MKNCTVREMVHLNLDGIWEVIRVKMGLQNFNSFVACKVHYDNRQIDWAHPVR